MLSQPLLLRGVIVAQMVDLDHVSDPLFYTYIGTVILSKRNINSWHIRLFSTTYT